ncbi:MAG: hypothetical protein LAO19_15135 [Acidobacteriia bacterium]|nr:hypothetical protein [Terriglobia bacterium]
MGMGKTGRIQTFLLAGCLAASLLPSSARAADLKPETVRAFDHYVQLLEMRMDGDLRDGNFLYIDRNSSDARQQLYSQIRHGDPYINQLAVEENGVAVPVPFGLIHHWIGVAFIPGATYSQTLAILLDFDKQAQIYKPDIQKSKLLETNGNKSKVFLQYLKKSLVTVVLNANFDSEYLHLSPTRGELRSHSTRIAELQYPGTSQERELPMGKDHGYLWRLNSYWSLEEKDGGVYVQIESVALSRRIPGVISWVIGPIVRNLSRAVVRSLLSSTCKAVHDEVISGRGLADTGSQSCVTPPDAQDSTVSK